MRRLLVAASEDLNLLEEKIAEVAVYSVYGSGGGKEETGSKAARNERAVAIEGDS